MRKVTTVALAISLLVGSAAFAQDSYSNKKDTFSSFYPVEDLDSPSYIQDLKVEIKSNRIITLAKSTIPANSISAFYPEEDLDSPSYFQNKTEKNVLNIIQKSTITSKVLNTLYQES